jgi:hypothetical protein
LLAAADLALLASTAAALAASRRLRAPEVPDLGSAFGILERAIRTYVPALPPGYTWGEAFERLKETGIEADWDAMNRRLRDYEACRYGGRESTTEGKDDVILLALRLKKTIYDKRAKR